MTHYWHPVEEHWRGAHLEQMAPLLELTSETHALVARVAKDKQLLDAAATYPARLLQSHLLRRLARELRAIELLAERGYGIQALSSACTLFEQCHFLTFATKDEKIANDYFSWSDLDNPMQKVKALVRISGEQRGWDEERIDAEYEKYRFLCSFKHNNPMLVHLWRFPVDPEEYLSRLALAESNWFMLTSVTLSASTCFDDASISEVIHRAKVLMDRAQAEYQRLPLIPPPEQQHEGSQ